MIGRTSFLLRAAALCGALALWASPSAADDLIPSLNLQTGFAFTRSPGNDSDDYFVAATPQLTYFIEGERALVSITYAFTGSLNTFLPNGIANHLTLATTYDVSPKTQLLFGADALQALIGNYLLVQRAAATPIGGLPALNTSLLTASVTQGISHELSPVVRLTQVAAGTYVTSLDPDVWLRDYLATTTVDLDRSWVFDAVGGELNLQYASTFYPPLRPAHAATASLGPTWTHDISPTLSMSMSVSAQVAFSPDPGAETRIGPAGRAAIRYSSEGSGIGLEYVGGIQPNLLMGTLLQSHQATLRGFTPLSEKYHVVLGVSGGYLHAKNVDLAGAGAGDNEFDAVLHDADITWLATDFLAPFVRYEFIGQGSGDGPGAMPALVRHAAILGVDLFASPSPPRARLPQGHFPQRVDRADAPQQERPEASGASGASGAPGVPNAPSAPGAPGAPWAPGAPGASQQRR